MPMNKERRSEHAEILGVLRNWFANDLRAKSGDAASVGDWVRKEMHRVVEKKLAHLEERLDKLLLQSIDAIVRRRIGRDGSGLKALVEDLVRVEVKKHLEEQLDITVSISGSMHKPAKKRAVDLSVPNAQD